MIANWATGSVFRNPEPVTGPGLTVPNQSRPMSELVAKFIRGDKTDVFNGVYDENFPPGLENLTEIDRLEMSRDIDNQISETRERVRNRKHIKLSEAEKAALKNPSEKLNEGGTTE